MEQPYNCTKPGNLFVGYTRFIQEMLNGLRNGHSFALIGGRRCGKTSVLKQIEKVLTADGLEPFQVQVHHFSIHEFNHLSVEELFAFIYTRIAAGCPVDAWPEVMPRGAYQTFLGLLEISRSVLAEEKGSDWLAVLLIDELDAAITRLPDDTFFQNLRHCLMDSPFSCHFRVVASGAKEMASLIYSGSSPLNNLLHRYLRILSAKHARQLVQAGFGDAYEEDYLFKLTGRHPYLLQGLLEMLWDRRPGSWQKSTIKQAARDFLKEHKDFSHWLNTFGATEKAVYHQLTCAPGGTLSYSELKNKIHWKLRPDVEDAITVLSYHGIIDDSDPEEPELAGAMFKNWFLDKVGPEMVYEPMPTHAAPSLTGPHVQMERDHLQPGKLNRDKVFVSYSQKDKDILERVQTHLKVLIHEGISVNLWDDTKIKAGMNWSEEIKKALSEAKVAILLISTDFLASDFISTNELPHLLNAAKKDGATILSLILKPCRFAKNKKLSSFQSVNNPDKPMSKLSENEQDEILVKLTDRIAELVQT
jgi:hypothetical protein